MSDAPELLPCPFCGRTVNHETGKRVVCENCSCAGPWKGGKREAIAAWNRRADLSAAAETALAAERARSAKLVEAARDAEYDLLQWLECGEHLTKAGFNMDGTPEVVRNLTAALREFQEKSDAEA